MFIFEYHHSSAPGGPDKVDVVDVDPDLLGQVGLGRAEDGHRHPETDVSGPEIDFENNFPIFLKRLLVIGLKQKITCS